MTTLEEVQPCEAQVVSTFLSLQQKAADKKLMLIVSGLKFLIQEEPGEMQYRAYVDTLFAADLIIGAAPSNGVVDETAK